MEEEEEELETDCENKYNNEQKEKSRVVIEEALDELIVKIQFS